MLGNRSGSTASMLTVTRSRPASRSGCGNFREQVAIGRKGDFRLPTIHRPQRRQVAHKIDDSFAQERLAPG